MKVAENDGDSVELNEGATDDPVTIFGILKGEKVGEMTGASRGL